MAALLWLLGPIEHKDFLIKTEVKQEEIKEEIKEEEVKEENIQVEAVKEKIKDEEVKKDIEMDPDISPTFWGNCFQFCWVSPKPVVMQRRAD